MSLEGLPHSGIFGSKPVCGSPKLFAAYHALHRLLAPRHSPYALSSLTIRTLDADARRLRAPGSGLQPSLAAAPKPDVRDPRASAPRNAHCVCVVGKLPLQSIQLSKSPEAIVCFCFNRTRMLARLRPAGFGAAALAGLPSRSFAAYFTPRSEGWRIPGSNR
jgi:hypothetical protein